MYENKLITFLLSFIYGGYIWYDFITDGFTHQGGLIGLAYILGLVAPLNIPIILYQLYKERKTDELQ